MMTCREFAERLIDYLSEELGQDEVQRIKEHLDGCPPCVALLTTYRATIHLARKLPCHPLPSSCEQRLRAAVAEQWKQQWASNA
jgi:anti-sigma factor RsiW